MNLKTITAVALNVVTLTCLATPVKMPDEKTLNKRMANIGMNHFAEKTGIVKQMAGQQKEALAVVMAVELALYDYAELVKNPAVTITANMNKNMVIEAFLQDHPEKLQELAQQGL